MLQSETYCGFNKGQIIKNCTLSNALQPESKNLRTQILDLTPMNMKCAFPRVTLSHSLEEHLDCSIPGQLSEQSLRLEITDRTD